MKPFLILQLRPETEASDDEFEAFLKHGNLSREEVERIRMEKEGLPPINLDNYSGVLVGGGPFNVSDKEKDEIQRSFESDLFDLFDEIVDRDFPYLGSCYGLCVLVSHQGSKIGKGKYSEDVGRIDIKLTDEGREDPLLEDLPDEFSAFGGHKESCHGVPDGAVVLAKSETCPVQMVRIGENVYGAQFHTELDQAGMAVRIRVYKDAGYFPPEDADKLIAKVKQEKVEYPMKILEGFVEKYRVE